MITPGDLSRLEAEVETLRHELKDLKTQMKFVLFISFLITILFVYVRML